MYCILYSCSGEYNLSLSGPASSPARKQSQCCPARLGQGQGWFLDWRLAGGAAGPGLGPNSLLTLVDVALQAPVLLRSDSATCHREGNLVLLCYAPPFLMVLPSLLISYRRTMTFIHALLSQAWHNVTLHNYKL